MPKYKTTTHPTLTKLNRPLLPVDFIPRERLLERLERGRSRPLTLVSSPAGYGKSTLVSSWLDRCDCPGAWVSLDTRDNDLHLFLSSFLTSIQTLFPGTGNRVQRLLSAPGLPPTQVLAHILANELERMEQDFILVLDDFHVIHEKTVSALIGDLLRHPPRPLHLVLVSRKDPFLPIPSLRATDQVTEVRTHDLRFTDPEVHAFLKSALGDQVQESTGSALAEKMEGWVTGLRLAVLATRGHDNAEQVLSELAGSTRYVMDYLVFEVLENQSPAVRRLLLRSSILDRFCPSLCDTLCSSDGKTGPDEIDGQGFIAGLQRDNIFLIPLDLENHWFRFHHLFQDFLKHRLRRNYTPEEIATLHSRASKWFQDRGLIDEAITHALDAGDSLAAVKIIERNRHVILDAEQWHVLRRWLDRLPPETRQGRPDLLIGQAWILLQMAQVAEIIPILEGVEAIVDEASADPVLLSEINLFRGILCYFQDNGERSLAFFTKAAEQFPRGSFLALKSTVEYWLHLALHRVGQKKTAIRSLHEKILGLDAQEGMMLSRLTFSLGYIHMLDNECLHAFQEGLHLREISRSNRLLFAGTWGMYVQGNASFQMFDLDAASHYFSQVVENRYIANPRTATDAMTGLAITRQLMREPDEADKIMQLAQAYAEWTKYPEHLEIVRSCRARLALLRGDIGSASHWQETLRKTPGTPMMLFFLEIPVVTECRVLIAIGSEDSLKIAMERLEDIRKNAKVWHNTCQMMEVLVLQALASHRLGQSEASLETLEQAVALAMPGNSIRSFVEPGLPMVDLLQKLAQKNVAVNFIKKVMTALNRYEAGSSDSQLSGLSRHRPKGVGSAPRPPAVPPSPLADSLSNRELDVLELLTHRLRNKEIAEKLFISPETVRTHLRNIYPKLKVTSRRQATARAVDLGLFPGS